ncbi:MAG: hypothetical protein CV087_10155 [Candidatus Brocadia sp. WS118]|nr:MAG: hypothetical protein CV087_10155 [Candidatus Brocadia sp. WS118]
MLQTLKIIADFLVSTQLSLILGRFCQFRILKFLPFRDLCITTRAEARGNSFFMGQVLKFKLLFHELPRSRSAGIGVENLIAQSIGAFPIGITS